MKNNIGEYIKAERLRYRDGDSIGVSQIDLSLKIGWENPSTLSRIEQGRIMPTKDTIVKIFKALEIDDDVIAFILIKSMYLYTYPMTKDYINKMINKTRSLLDDLNYPAIISLYPNSTIEINTYINNVGEKIFFGDKINIELIKALSEEPDLLNILLNPEYNIIDRILNRDEFINIIISNLHIVYNDTLEERKYINKLMKLPNFTKFWKKSEKLTFDDFRTFNIPFVYDSPLIGKISFFMQKMTVLEDNRFFIQEFIPKGKDDFAKLDKIISR